MSRYHLPPGAGSLVDLGGVGVRFKVGPEWTSGALSVVEHPVAPRVVVEPHVHGFEDELSIVTEGSIWVRVGDDEFEAPAGSYVWKPRGVYHSFWNPHEQPAHLIEIITPSGFERFFAELAAALDGNPEGLDARIGEMVDRYGLGLEADWLDDIQSRFGPLRMV